MKSIRLGIFLVAALMLSGCASTQRLSEADRARARTVAIAPAVQKGQLFLLAPSGANVGLMFGAVGGLAASGTVDDNQKAFAAFLDKNAVSVDAIVRDEFEKVLRDSGKVALAPDSSAALPVISVSVTQYGFGVTHLLSSNVVPVMQMEATMTDSAGKVLWKESERMLPSIASPMQTTTWTQLHDNPKSIEVEWRKAAHYLAEKIVATL
ncbi:hypothetical protein ACI48D_00910 [Massilia sp. LXY-6]|uniref:hypothetical protein n=1 Tax=Massilia sp. LXY-6 TaxID=3379823 RepID=UPI003EE30213